MFDRTERITVHACGLCCTKQLNCCLCNELKASLLRKGELCYMSLYHLCNVIITANIKTAQKSNILKTNLVKTIPMKVNKNILTQISVSVLTTLQHINKNEVIDSASCMTKQSGIIANVRGLC